LGGDAAKRSDAGPVSQPADELGVVVPEAEVHQAPERLATVRLGDAEVALALDEPGDEVALAD
jgi:hypothetical protein